MTDVNTTKDRDDLSTLRGTELIATFHRLLKGACLYGENNAVLNGLTQEFLAAVNRVMRSDGHLFLRIVRDNVYLNAIKIQIKTDQYPLLRGFLHEMRQRCIGEMEFSEEMNEEKLKEFVFLLAKLEEHNESNYLYVKKQLESRGILTIDVGKMEFFNDEEIYVDSDDRRRYSKEVYFKSIGLVKEVLESVKSQKMLDVRKAKRRMQNAVDAIVEDESALLGLANIKNYDEYTFNHSVNVAIYAIAMGQRIGIPKKHLSHLGMAAMFHDIGEVRIPKEVLNKTEKLTPEEWSIMRLHPLAGAEMVIGINNEWGELSTRMINATFEHHLKYDLTGYPTLTQKRRISLFSRIIALADFYDALVRPRAYNRFPFVSEKILDLMLERSGKYFDPALVKVFIQMVGVFPLGTLALLNTNEMGVVVQTQEDIDLIDRPKVNLIYYNGGEYQRGQVVDLREMDEKTGDFRRTVIKTLDPNEYNVNVAEFIL